jgi:hypothetical protein
MFNKLLLCGFQIFQHSSVSTEACSLEESSHRLGAVGEFEGRNQLL